MAHQWVKHRPVGTPEQMLAVATAKKAPWATASQDSHYIQSGAFSTALYPKALSGFLAALPAGLALPAVAPLGLPGQGLPPLPPAPPLPTLTPSGASQLGPPAFAIAGPAALVPLAGHPPFGLPPDPGGFANAIAAATRPGSLTLQALDLPSGLVAPAGASPVVANRIPLTEYRQRLAAIYQQYKPDNLAKIDYLLQKYQGREEFLYQSVCQKYGLNPDVGLPGVVALAPSSQGPPAPWDTTFQPSLPPLPVALTAGLALPPWSMSAPTPTVEQGSAKAVPSAPPQLAASAAGLQAGTLQGSLPRPLGTLAAVAEPVTEPARQPARPRETRQVMEWDPATGRMVATMVDLDNLGSEVAALLGDTVVQSAVDCAKKVQSLDARLDVALSQPPRGALGVRTGPAQVSTGHTPAGGNEEMDEDDEYDPFSTSPESQTAQQNAAKDMVNIDLLLLGERSGFFEAPGALEATAEGSSGVDAPALVNTADKEASDEVAATDGLAQPVETEAADSDAEELPGMEASFDPYLVVDAADSGLPADDEAGAAAASEAEMEDAIVALSVATVDDSSREVRAMDLEGHDGAAGIGTS